MDITLKEWAVREIDLACAKAETLRAGGDAYTNALDAVLKLQQIRDNEIWRQCADEDRAAGIRYDQPVLLNTEPKATEPEVSEPAPEPEPTDDRPIPKLEDVRGKCGEAKKAGVDIKSILNELGYKNLSGVDSKDYNALLDKVAAALEAMG